MTTGLVLIAAILVLGGVIATVGDRLGMKVGKARLSLFKLRPRQTATLITILTGTLISASTFGILFAVDDQLRRGVFDFQEIQAEKRQAEEERDLAQRERQKSQQELVESQQEQVAAERRLRDINQSLRGAIAQRDRIESQLNTTESQLNSTRTKLSQVEAQFQQARTLLQSISQQQEQLQSEIRQLEAARQQQLAERDRAIAERDQALNERNRAIAEREAQLRRLETQRVQLQQDVQALEQEVQTLEREFQGLRQGNVALTRNQSLSSGIVRIVSPDAAQQAVNRLLREANRLAVQRIRPGATDPDRQVIQVTTGQVEQVTSQIKDGRDYVVRILSSGNYVVGEPCVLAGEPCVQVYITADLNQVIFDRGEIIATTSIDPGTMNNARLFDRINLLLAASQFRARQAGIVTDTIQLADGNPDTLEAFFVNLRQYKQPLDVQAIAATTTYTAGPLRIELAAVQDGRIVFSTLADEPSPPQERSPSP